MTERRQRRAHEPQQPQYYGAERAPKMTNDFDLSPRKTLLVIVVIIGCFAVLWPKIFYPMLVENANQHIKPSPIDKTTGCCDVISEMDINTIKIMSELCSTIIESNFDTPPKPQEIVRECRNAVLETCGIDISAALHERVSLGHSVKQILEEVRSLNGSLCLKYNFGVSPSRLGVPHRITVNMDSSASIRQERPSHLRSEMIHPAFRERGRAIPQPEVVQRTAPPPRIVEGRPGPIPGLRPAMGGGGHVVHTKQQHAGLTGFLMPIYTIGIVVFFTYTVMKIMYKKKPDYETSSLYPPVDSDEYFRKEVFHSERRYAGQGRDSKDTKLGDVELDQLRQRLRETELAMERIVEQMAKVPLNLQDVVNNINVVTNGSAVKPQEEEQPSVKIMGMEMTASCEGGKKWSRPDSPVLPSGPPPQPEPQPEPQEIFLEGILPPQSQLLVADSATEAQKEDEDSAVVLAGKMTLSVISLDSSENGTDESSPSDKKRDSIDIESRTNSSHGSEEFEKIEPYHLEELRDFTNETQKVVETSESDFSLVEEIEKITQEILDDIKQESDDIQKLEDRNYEVVKEIKEQLELDDDLVDVLEQETNETKRSVQFMDPYLKDDDLKTEEESEQETPSRLLSSHSNESIEQFVDDILHKAEHVVKEEQDEQAKEKSHLDEGSNKKSVVRFSQEEIVQSEDNSEASDAETEEEDLNIAPVSKEEIVFDTPEKEELGSTVIEGEQQLTEEETESNSDEDEELDDINFEENVNYHIENEIRNAGSTDDIEERLHQEHVNGDNNSGHRDSEEDTDERLSDEEEEIEEIIEYVDNSDEEGEEIIEVSNGVSQTNEHQRNTPH